MPYNLSNLTPDQTDYIQRLIQDAEVSTIAILADKSTHHLDLIDLRTELDVIQSIKAPVDNTEKRFMPTNWGKTKREVLTEVVEWWDDEARDSAPPTIDNISDKFAQSFVNDLMNALYDTAGERMVNAKMRIMDDLQITVEESMK